MSEVKARTGEVLDSVIRRWKRFVEKKGTLKVLRKKEFHQKKTTLKQLAKATAIKRWKKKLAKEMLMLSGARTSSRGSRRGGRDTRREAAHGGSESTHDKRE